MNNRFVAIIVLVILFGSGGLAQSEAAQFVFNPADFFDYSTADGFSPDGGMFGLSRNYYAPPDPGVNNFGSWYPAERAVLDTIRSSMGPDEGIGYVQVWLPKTPGYDIWGQILSTSGAPTGTAPAGWTAFGAIDVGPAWIFEWWANPSGSTFNYLSPGEDMGDFTLSFTPNEVVSQGTDYTIWFGGANYPGALPDAINFDDSDGAPFASGDLTGYQATRSLTNVPEPASFIVWGGLGMLIGTAVWRRRRRKS
jgi:hypothetical protein